MEDPKKKTPPASKSAPNEKWLERLGVSSGEAPGGIAVYVGLLRQNPADDSQYQLYQTLDMRSCLHIGKADVVHIEELAADKSPFGSLGGARVFVRAGSKIQSVRTSTNTFEAGADDFDLDIRLGPLSPRATSSTAACGNPSVPETQCGDACNTLPPFSDPDVGPCHTVPQTICGCTAKCTIDTCGCPPTGQPTCQCNPPTARTNCAQTCILTNCGTCQTCNTCATNCGTCQTCHTCATNCGTCNTHCGTCAANTCATKCGQPTCIACTHVHTRCPGQTCQIP
jgi:hypothetical protein